MHQDRAPAGDFERKARASNTIYVGPGFDYTSVQAGVTAASTGWDVVVSPNTYDAEPGDTVTVPTGVRIVGSGINCVLEANLILQGTASAEGIYIADGYYVQQSGAQYWGGNLVENLLPSSGAADRPIAATLDAATINAGASRSFDWACANMEDKLLKIFCTGVDDAVVTVTLSDILIDTVAPVVGADAAQVTVLTWTVSAGQRSVVIPINYQGNILRFTVAVATQNLTGFVAYGYGVVRNAI